jgi:hypothetical protein
VGESRSMCEGCRCIYVRAVEHGARHGPDVGLPDSDARSLWKRDGCVDGQRSAPPGEGRRIAAVVDMQECEKDESAVWYRGGGAAAGRGETIQWQCTRDAFYRARQVRNNEGADCWSTSSSSCLRARWQQGRQLIFGGPGS